MSRFVRTGERRPLAPPRASVADWEAALALAARVWRAAEAEDPRSASADPEGDLLKLRAWMQQLAAETFPGGAVIGQLLAGAWLNTARVVTHPATSSDMRTSCAPALRETTQLVDRLLTLHRAAQAEPWRRQFRDDD